MKRKELLIANIFLGIVIASFAYLAFRLSLNQSPFQQDSYQIAAEENNDNVGSCSDKPKITLPETNDINLNKLRQYQQVCNSFVANELMFFIGFSGDKEEAASQAADIAPKLKAFHQAGVKPIVVAEPYVKDEAMSYKAYLAGAYDEPMDYFFQKLKEAGVTDDMMGKWVPFPESNTPSWNNKDTEPHDYALCVNKYLKKLKEYYPKAEGSILLSATTYEPDDEGWENGDYINLSEYVNAIDKDLVNSFGIQGFPWVSNAQQTKRTIYKAHEFLQPDFAIGAAQILRTRDIWINTGTFATKYTNDPAKTVQVSINERKAILEGILQEAKNIRDYQQNEYRVTINLFAENKSKATEATDWSYFQNTESTMVLKDFLVQANKLHVPISLFDQSKWQLQ